MSVINLARVIVGMLDLSRILAVTQLISSSIATAQPSVNELNALFGLWNLAQVNPYALEGTALEDLVSAHVDVSIDEQSARVAEGTLLLLAEVQESDRQPSSDLWSSAQFWAVRIVDRLSGRVTDETARRRKIGLEHCDMELDPEEWCAWAMETMDCFATLGDLDNAAAIGLKAVDAYTWALRAAPDSANRRNVTERFHYLSRRVAFHLLLTGDTERAIDVLDSIRGRSRVAIPPADHGRSAYEVSRAWETTLLYLVAGPDCTLFLAVNESSDWKTSVLKIDSLGGRQLIALLMGLSPSAPGLLGAQNLTPAIFQNSLDETFARLSPMVTEVHNWLNGLAVEDVAVVPTGPYFALPLICVPVRCAEGMIPFGWLRRCTLLPSAVWPTSQDTRRAAIREMLLAAEAIRPEMEKLRTRTECESIKSQALTKGWSATLLLGNAVTRQALVERTRAIGIVHFAGHARTDSFDPNATVLCLTDGDLNFDDLFEDHSSAPQMLVLSACQTGQSTLLQAPDENFGFVTGAMDAGVAIVVGSLWPVADRETSQFMKVFYSALFRRLDQVDEISGLIVHDALIEAQRSRGAPDYTTSRHWAAFQVFGL